MKENTAKIKKGVVVVQVTMMEYREGEFWGYNMV